MHLVRRMAVALMLATAGISAPVASRAAPAATAPSPTIDALFDQWLAAFNADDPAALKAFHAQYLNDPDPAFVIDAAQDSCGLSMDHVEERSADALVVLLRQRCLPGLQRLRIERTAPGAPTLKTLEILPVPLPGDGAVAALTPIADRLAARDAFAGSLIIARGGRRLLARSWGAADPVMKTPMTLDTPMFLASAGKMFTGVAVLQLVEAGKVDLDAPLGRYLTDYPNPEMAKVTIRQLLTHRGGTGDMGILAREDGASRAKVRTISDIVRLNGARGPDFVPGSQADYSNYGFILLGAVIEKVTGGRYEDYVARHIFAPAGMKNSGFPDREHLGGVAIGYTTYFGAEPTPVPNLDVLPWRGLSAGGGVASPNDMLAFFDALTAGRLLSPAMLKQATTAGETPWYGMGFIVDAGDHPHWGHGGVSYGADLAFQTYGGDGTTVICMAARDMVCNRLYFAYHLRKYGLAQ